MGRGRKWTPQEDEAAWRAHRAGWSATAIAAELPGRTRKGVSVRLTELRRRLGGADAPARRIAAAWTAEEDAILLRAVREGLRWGQPVPGLPQRSGQAAQTRLQKLRARLGVRAVPYRGCSAADGKAPEPDSARVAQRPPSHVPVPPRPCLRCGKIFQRASRVLFLCQGCRQAAADDSWLAW